MNAIITGASKGIGYHTAVKLAKKGYNLLLLSRDEALLQNLCAHCRKISPGSVNYKKFDLSDLSGYLLDLKSFIDEHFDSTVDILINNAGKLVNKEFTGFTEQEIMEMMNVNFMGLPGLSLN